MTINPLHRNGAEEMTLRARWYLTIGALRHYLIGGFALGYPQMFVSPAYVPLLNYAPLPFWAVAFIVAGTCCLLACWNRSANYARVGLILSATFTAAWAVALGLGIVDAWMHGVRITPVLVILLVSLAAKDYAVCTQPLRSPFEQLLGDRLKTLHRQQRRSRAHPTSGELLEAALRMRQHHPHRH